MQLPHKEHYAWMILFPTDAETVQAALKKSGIDGIQYDEIFIADYDGSMPQLYELEKFEALWTQCPERSGYKKVRMARSHADMPV